MERESGSYWNKKGKQMDTKKFLRLPSMPVMAILTIVMTGGFNLALTSGQFVSCNILPGAV
jgi:hypothetical protein